MINNFEQIKELLTFNSEDEFYFIQVLQRKKDNPEGSYGSNNSSRLIQAYYINSLEKLDKYSGEMITLANIFNARVGINLNKRSYYKTAFNTLKKIAEQMHNKNFQSIHSAWSSCCGIKNNKDRIWLLDVDKITDVDILYTIDYPEERRLFHMTKCIEESNPIKEDKIIAKIPSKNGYHLIVKAFDSREFIKQFPEVCIHKNNPTNLYIP